MCNKVGTISCNNRITATDVKNKIVSIIKKADIKK